MSAIRLNATETFLKFARPAASKCGTDKVLLLSYNYVQTKSVKEFKWVLNVVSRADFRGAPSTVIDGLEVLYQPEMADELDNGILDLRDGTITVIRA